MSRWVAWLRARFITTALLVEPGLFDGLRNLYAIFARGPDADGFYDTITLNEGLSGMLERYNLDRGQWIYLWVFRQLTQFSDHPPDPEGERQLIVSFPIEDSESEVSTPPPSPAITWNPFVQSRQEMERAYKEYLDSVERRAREGGYAPVFEKRTAEHFLWLAAYQVLGYSINGIADALDESRQKVQYGIKSLAREMDLSLRDPKDRRKVTPAEISNRLQQYRTRLGAVKITERMTKKSTPENEKYPSAEHSTTNSH